MNYQDRTGQGAQVHSIGFGVLFLSITAAIFGIKIVKINHRDRVFLAIVTSYCNALGGKSPIVVRKCRGKGGLRGLRTISKAF